MGATLMMGVYVAPSILVRLAKSDFKVRFLYIGFISKSPRRCIMQAIVRNRSRHGVVFAMACAIVIVASNHAWAADGDLDPDWATFGFTTVGNIGTFNQGYGMAVQCDGKVVMTGLINSLGAEDAELAVVRFNPDGTLDSSFASNGIFAFDPSLFADHGTDVAIQQDGKIVVVGSTIAGLGGWDFAVLRLTQDGTFDPSFSGNGYHTFEFGGASRAHGVALQDDGRIVVVGETTNTSAMAIARLTTDGALDTTFDGDGLKIVDFTLGDDSAWDVAIQNDGRILVVGTATANPGSVVTIIRFLTDGAFDTGFGIGGGGAAALDFGISSEGRGIALQHDGRIVVAGYTDDLTSIAVGRLTSEGLADPTFGANGMAIHDFGIGDDVGLDVAIAHDGRILVAGSIEDGAGGRAAVTRFRANGSVDTDFGYFGTWVEPVFNFSSVAHALVIQPHDGRLLIAGSAVWGPIDERIFVFRVVGDSTLVFAGNFECGDTTAWN